MSRSHTTDTQKQLLKLEKQCTQLTSKLKAQEERIRRQDEQLDLMLQLLIDKSEATRKDQIKFEEKKPRATTYARTPMLRMTIGGGLLYVMQHLRAKLANELLDLSTIACPFQRTSRENVGFWKTSMVVADAIWLTEERQCVIRAAYANNDDDDDDETVQQQVQSICDTIDQWAVRLTSIISGRPAHALRPYMVGLAHNLVREGKTQEVFLPRTFKIEWTSPENQERYQTTTPLRDWIVEQELLRNKNVPEEDVERVDDGDVKDDDEVETNTKRPRL